MANNNSINITEELKNEAEKQIIEEKTPISYDTREYTVELIVKKYQEKEWFVPRYQREFVWREDKQSKFIESVLLDLPIPYLFLADDLDTGKLEIVDGSQRIRTLEAFVSGKLKLEGLKKLDFLNGFYFKNLLEPRQRRFLRKTIRSIELTEKASWFVRKDLFERINTKPYDLTPMEIRKGMFGEELYQFFDECSKDKVFAELCPISDKRLKREEGPEMVLRYFAYSRRYKKFQHNVSDFLDEYLIEIAENYDLKEMRNDFDEMLRFVEKYFPYGFKKSKTSKSTPRVRFEAISVGVRLALNIEKDLTPNDITKWINSDDFNEHTKSDAANNRLKVVGRFEYVRDKLLGK